MERNKLYMDKRNKRINEKRGRPAMKPTIKQLICAKALQDKGIPRIALAIELKKQIEEMGEIPPTEDTIVKLISKVRNYPVSPRDEPWNLGTLENHPIPPEALPSILEVWRHCRNEFYPFTIREAKWVSHLYALFREDVNNLAQAAQFYAQEELFSEISGVSFFGFDEPKGVLHLYQRWKRIEFTQEERSKLLATPAIANGKSVAEQYLVYAQKQGKGLLAYRERPDARGEAPEAAKE